MESVLVLNADYSHLAVVGWRRAIALVVKGKAEVVEHYDRLISNAEGTVRMRLPKVLKLLYYVQRVMHHKVTYSKRNVLLRDGYRCAYCGARGPLTIDHVLPRSRGGKTSFENTVACCPDCNSKKGDRTPEKAGMRLRKKPYTPSIYQIIQWRYQNRE